MLAETTRPVDTRQGAVAVGTLTLAVAVLYLAYSVMRFWDFHTTTYDLVIFDQGVRSYSHLHLPVSIAKGVHNGFGPHFNVLGDHFSPILAVLAPLYWIHNGPLTLVIVQSVLLALAIIPLWAYARRRLSPVGACCVTLVYALGWPVAETLAFDFHEMAFVPVLSMLMLERQDAGRRWQSVAAAGALLLVKEDMGLLVAGFGLYLLTRSGERRGAVAFIAGGLLWTWLASRVLIPAFGGRADYYWAYDALGRDLPHAAGNALMHPWHAVKLLVTPQVKATTMLWLVAPLLLLPLASPITLAVLPLLAERMLSSRFGHWWEPRFHYNVALATLLVAAAIDGASRLTRLRHRGMENERPAAESEGPLGDAQTVDGEGLEAVGGRAVEDRPGLLGRRPRAVGEGSGSVGERAPADGAGLGTDGREVAGGSAWRRGGGWVLGKGERFWPVAALLVTLAVLPHYSFKRFFESGFYHRDAHARAAADVLDAVPDGALVEAPNSVGPMLAGRTRVLLWDDRPRWAPWVVADTGRLNFPFPTLDAQRRRVDLLVRSGYRVVRRDDGFLVLNKPGSVPDLRPIQ